ncbi:MAG: rfbX [Microvirga sp.]|jgi:O-antigen/teichoic acid export membrane protein|nr:rfbX [Microvirga sp.]
MATAAAGALRTDADALSRARRSALTVFAIRVAAAALAYGTQVLLARLMGKEGYGVFATAWVWIAVLGHASLGGFGLSVCRFVPQHRVRGELALARGFLATGALATLASPVTIAAAGAGALWLLRGLVSPDYLLALAIALCVVPIFALQDYVEGVARGFNWTALAIAPPFILRQALIAIGMLLALAWGAPAEPWVAVGCTWVATATAVVLQAGLLVRALRSELPPGSRAYRLREWFAATLPIGFAELTLILFGFVDVLILGLFVPPGAVGLYFAATRLLQFVVFVQYAATAATAPRFAEAWTRGDRETLRRLIRGTVRLTALASFGVGAALLIAAPWLLAMFGQGFGASFGVLAILLCGVAVQSLCGPAEDLLNMLGAERTAALVSLGALLFALALSLALIPLFGIAGAAAAMAIATAARGSALALAAKARLGLATHLFA